METAITFTAGALIGCALAQLRPSVISPPKPPPMPPLRPKTRILYQMKQINLPLSADGEDSRKQIEEQRQPLKITESDITKVVLKKTPPRLSVEEKKVAFFTPQAAFHVELLNRFSTK